MRYKFAAPVSAADCPAFGRVGSDSLCRLVFELFRIFGDARGFKQHRQRPVRGQLRWIENRAAAELEVDISLVADIAHVTHAKSRKKSLIYGGSTGFFLQLPVDVWDGLYDGYGFSWGDVLANTTGAALFTAQELLWDELEWAR